MKRLACFFALALSACATSGMVSTTPAAFPAASEFNRLANPAAVFDTPLAVVENYARYEPGYEGAGAFDLMSRRSSSPDVFEMLFSVDGYADDSVRGEQWRVLIRRESGGWRVIEAGRRYLCYRGGNPGQWQKALCV